MRSGYNETTAAILGALSGKKGSADAVAKALGMDISTVSSTLLRLFRYGHVDRERVQRGHIVLDEDEGVTRPRYVYLYSMTGAGKKRLGSIKTKPRKSRK